MILDRTSPLIAVCAILLVSSAASGSSVVGAELDVEAANRKLADTSHVDFSGEVPVVVARLKSGNGDGVHVHEQQEHVFRAPYYDLDEEPSPQELQTFARKTVARLMSPLKDIVESAMIKNRGTFMMLGLLATSGLKYLFTIREIRQQSRVLKRKYNLPVDERFGDETMAILPELISQAKAELAEASEDTNKKYENAQDRASVARRIILILDGIRELVNNSPVGSHLRFKELTIDGVPMVDGFVENIKFMQKSGLGYLLDRMSSYCSKAVENNKKAIAEEMAARGELVQ